MGQWCSYHVVSFHSLLERLAALQWIATDWSVADRLTVDRRAAHRRIPFLILFAIYRLALNGLVFNRPAADWLAAHGWVPLLIAVHRFTTDGLILSGRGAVHWGAADRLVVLCHRDAHRHREQQEQHTQASP